MISELVHIHHEYHMNWVMVDFLKELVVVIKLVHIQNQKKIMKVHDNFIVYHVQYFGLFLLKQIINTK